MADRMTAKNPKQQGLGFFMSTSVSSELNACSDGGGSGGFVALIEVGEVRVGQGDFDGFGTGAVGVEGLASRAGCAFFSCVHWCRSVLVSRARWVHLLHVSVGDLLAKANQVCGIGRVNCLREVVPDRTIFSGDARKGRTSFQQRQNGCLRAEFLVFAAGRGEAGGIGLGPIFANPLLDAVALVLCRIDRVVGGRVGIGVVGYSDFDFDAFIGFQGEVARAGLRFMHVAVDLVSLAPSLDLAGLRSRPSRCAGLCFEFGHCSVPPVWAVLNFLPLLYPGRIRMSRGKIS